MDPIVRPVHLMVYDHDGAGATSATQSTAKRQPLVAVQQAKRQCVRCVWCPSSALGVLEPCAAVLPGQPMCGGQCSILRATSLCSSRYMLVSMARWQAALRQRPQGAGRRSAVAAPS